jgi:hypothetical protein
MAKKEILFSHFVVFSQYLNFTLDNELMIELPKLMEPIDKILKLKKDKDVGPGKIIQN